jgi:hypothetical protein
MDAVIYLEPILVVADVSLSNATVIVEQPPEYGVTSLLVVSTPKE